MNNNKKYRALQELERLFGGYPHHGSHQQENVDFATDISEDEGNLYVSIHVPGIKADKIDISVDGNQLRVVGKREEEHVTGDKRYVHEEIEKGSFERIFTLPCAVDEAKINAELGDGVLHIALPKKDKSAGRQIKIKRV